MSDSFRAHSAGYLLNHIARQFALLLHERLKPLGIAPAQFPILLELWQQDGQSQQALVERAELSQATIANTLARMERDGLICREPNPDDARSRLIYLSDSARSLETAAVAAAAEINREALAALNDDEQTAFLDMAARVVAQQQRMLGKAPLEGD